MAKTTVDNAKLLQLQKQIQAIPEFALDSELQKALSAAKKYKKNPVPHFAAANFLIRKADYVTAIDYLKNALKLTNNPDVILSNLAYIYSSFICDYREAIRYLNKKLSSNKKDVATLMMMANCYLKIGEPDKALDKLNIAEPLTRDKIRIYGMRSQCHVRLGDSEAAKREYLSIRDSHPKGIIAVGDMLATLPNNTDDERKQLSADLADAIKNRSEDFRDDTHRSMTYSGLGVLSEKLGRHKEAFQYFTLANKIQPIDENAFSFSKTKEFKILHEVFDAQLFEQVSSQGHPTKEHAFILGMPRSGTTLIESILAGHSKCMDFGELEFFNHQLHVLGVIKNPEITASQRAHELKQNLINAPYDGFSNIAEQYMDRYKFLEFPDIIKIDKMPLNFRALGLIALFLPNSKIIHSKRHPMDTCLSIYQTPLKEYNTTFANDLETLGTFYLEYVKLMKHWHNVLPLDIHEVRYEDLVNNTKIESKKLINYLGLEWEEACIINRKSKRDVQTASAWQVRNDIYKTSVQKWRMYEKELEPLTEILATEIKAYETKEY